MKTIFQSSLRSNPTSSFILALILFLPPWITAEAKTWNVKDYGVKGDGKTPERNAIQAVIEKACQDGGGTVFFPAVHTDQGECYLIDVPKDEKFYALQMRDNVILEGEGSQSLLKNPSSDTKSFGRTHIFIWGTAFPQRWADARKWPIQNVKAGATEVQIKNPEKLTDFKVGEIIRVSDHRVHKFKNGVDHEWYGQIFRIMEVKNGSATLVLSHDMKIDIQDPILHKIEDCFDPGLGLKKGFGTWKAGMRNLALESKGRITQRGGAVQCFMENIESKGMSGVLYGNAWHDCRFKNIREKVTNAMELSDCSVGNIVENLVQEYIPGENKYTKKTNGWFWAGTQEGSSFNTISNFTYSLASAPWGQGVIKTGQGRNNTWMNGAIKIAKTDGPTSILCPGTHYNNGLGHSDNTTLKDIQIFCNAPAYYIYNRCGEPGSMGHLLENIQIHDAGGGAEKEAAHIEGENILFKNITGGKGTLYFTKSSSGNRIELCSEYKIRDEGRQNKTR